MKISDVLNLERVLLDIDARTREKVISAMAAKVAKELGVAPEKLVVALLEREATKSTAIDGMGIAIPHARLPEITKFIVLFARCSAGIDFKAEDGKPCKLFFLILGPENSPGDYLRLLARIARLCHDSEFRNKLMNSRAAEDVLKIIIERDERFA